MKKRAGLRQRLSWALTNPTIGSKALRTLAGMVAAGVPSAAIAAAMSQKQNKGRNAAVAGAIGALAGGLAGYHAPKLRSMYGVQQQLYDKYGRKILFPMRLLRTLNKSPLTGGIVKSPSIEQWLGLNKQVGEIVQNTSDKDIHAASKLGKNLFPSLKKLLVGSYRKQRLDQFQRMARQLAQPRRMNYPFNSTVIPGVKLPFYLGGQQLDYQLPDSN